MTAERRFDETGTPEPVVEDRHDPSPSIANAADDVAEAVLSRPERLVDPRDERSDRQVPVAPADPSDPPVADGPVNSA
ncbi:hypothetical protein [Cellulomonas sp. URHD0024]|uniref:hypothetical protein n=1 Tax=Cellulomonas sp. URHD0024 TaxID=1302620 RepID=UPI0004120201|nr:hypothetical protein [Cellulomonas sp. URHD0024]